MSISEAMRAAADKIMRDGIRKRVQTAADEAARQTGILVPPSVIEQRTDQIIAENRVKYEAHLAAHKSKVRAVILKHLKALDSDLGQFEQTCHGHISLPGGLAKLGESLQGTWDKPTAFNVSSLSQEIAQLVREYGALASQAPAPQG